MKYALLAALVAAIIVPSVARAEDIKEPGVIIGDACAEIWATKTNAEFEAEYGKAFQYLDAQYAVVQRDYNKADVDLEEKRKAYDAAIAGLVTSTGDLGKKAIELGQHQHATGSGAVPETLGGLVDMAAKGDTTGLAKGADLAVTNAANDAAFTAEHEAELAVTAAEAELRRQQARITIIDGVVVAVQTCARDQQAYLALFGPKTDTDVGDPSKPAAIDLKPYGDYRYSTGFKEPPGKSFDIASPNDPMKPYWWDLCQTQCLADSSCAAWNYIHPEWANPMPPARCQIYFGTTPGFTGYSFTDGAYISGYGPAAVGLGLARNP